MVKLGQISSILNGDRSGNYPSGDDFKEYGVPFINAGHIVNGVIDYSKMDYISLEKYNSLSGAKIKKNDLLLCLRGSLGKYALVTADGGAPASSLAVIRPILQKIDPQYLIQIISSPIFIKQILEQNNGSSQPNLSASNVADFYIPYPPLPEQQKIAEALSDMDDLITSLEKLIAKKKAIKQGAMQELLTGKKRLPGFSEEWKVFHLGDISTMFAGGTPDSKVSEYYGGNIPWVSISDITKTRKYLFDTQSTLTQLGLQSCSAKLLPRDTILFAMYASIGKCCIAQHSVCTSQAILGMYDFHNAVPEYVYYVLSNREQEFLHAGQTGTQTNLSKNIVSEIEIALPSLIEQKEITSILSDMDAEIEALEQKLTKCRQTKQGMMQQLLTGKIRLV